MNPLSTLYSEKQSFWLDYIRKSLLASGELKRMIDEDGLRGMTSNPTIFEKAISSGDEYDADIKKAALQKKSPAETFEIIAVKDIQKATDVFRPLYKSSGGVDGYVSLEVNPHLARDTKGTVQEAKRLAKKVNRPNLMIKVPGTQEGLPAVRELIAAGINVNVTLLFSVEVYKKVVDAYLSGLEDRLKKKQPFNTIASVASFFVSRVDTLIDKKLDPLILAGGSQSGAASKLLHKAAIANAKLAYAYYEDVIKSPRFLKLREKGAQAQRLLWASTGTKDKRLSDVIYVDQLIGRDTVNTIPPQTMEAFKDHGIVKATLATGLSQAREDIAALSKLGISLPAVTQELENQGVQAFIDSFDQLLHVVTAKQELFAGRHEKRQVLSLGKAQSDASRALKKIEQDKWIPRVWSKDALVWKTDEDHQKIIKNSLGWLTVMNTVLRKKTLLFDIAKDVKKAKFTHILLLGMGGSSLCPEVLRLTFGKKKGFPDFAILDSTEPASVAERAARSKPEKTLYIVASKSGSTSEPNAFLAYFFDQVKKKKGDKAGENFIAITDPGTTMERIAKEKKFRHIVLNPPDIGGRFSALSFFGMLPAALMGLDAQAILESGARMAAACSPFVPVSNNPGAELGAALGSLANQGKDKLTFTLSKEIVSLAGWIEQLVAESTGKEGKGILPVESEDLQDPSFYGRDRYGRDRVFVSIRLANDKDQSSLKKLAALEKAGFPVIRITMDKKTDIGGELFRWEFATAVAGALMGIDAFDQPNVQESKDLTKKYLADYIQKGSLPAESPTVKENGLSVTLPAGSFQLSSFGDVFKWILDQVKPGDYVALLAYLTRNDANHKILQSIRHSILAYTNVATTVGFGPRFLHSTGQLHKGGGDNGVFLQIIANDPADLPIPGEPYSFSVLKEAQALGDLSALKNKNRRAIRIHLNDAQQGLVTLDELIRTITTR